MIRLILRLKVKIFNDQCVTQSWNFFHQLYNYSKKILYETQQNIYI